jgi:TolB-like protein
MKNLINAVSGLVILFLTLSGALAADEKNRPEIKTVGNYIAVFDFEITTGDKGISRPLTDRVIHEFSQSGRYEVIDRGNMNKILGEQKFQFSGCVAQECKVEAGQLLGVGRIVTGSVGMVGKVYYLTLQLINVQTGKVELSAEDECRCELEELLSSTRRLSRKLIGEKVETPARDVNTAVQQAMTLKDSQKQTYLALAQQAFNEKKFAEPSGDNTIEYTRKILADDPGNSAAIDLEKRALAAYENEAVFARARKNEARALEIYQRLFSLYPEKKQYLDEFVKLETAKAIDISGNWQPVHVSGDVAILSDGRCIYKGFLIVSIAGKWTCTDPHKRQFSIAWNHGFTDMLTLSADGRRLEGVNNIGDPVAFVRIK